MTCPGPHLLPAWKLPQACSRQWGATSRSGEGKDTVGCGHRGGLQEQSREGQAPRKDWADDTSQTRCHEETAFKLQVEDRKDFLLVISSSPSDPLPSAVIFITRPFAALWFKAPSSFFHPPLPEMFRSLSPSVINSLAHAPSLSPPSSTSSSFGMF